MSRHHESYFHKVVLKGVVIVLIVKKMCDYYDINVIVVEKEK